MHSNDVTYAIRSQQNPRNQNFFTSLDVYKINPSKPVKFMIHGWTDRGTSPLLLNLTEAYFSKQDYNIVAVNWHEPAAKPYPVSVRNARFVGR